MSSGFLPFWLPLALFALLWLYLLLHKQFRLAERTIDEVTVFLRKIDWDEINQLFDLGEERYLRVVQSDYHYKRSMRVRIHKAREFLARMYHNVRVVHEWANTELQDVLHKTPAHCTEREKQMMAIAEKAAYFRALTMFRLFELTLWTVLRVEKWPVLRIPSVARLRQCGEKGQFDLLDLYGELKEASAGLALVYGKQFYDEILAVL
jgi:hypothetical protein